MDCVIPAHNIKVFSNAITSLCRVGKELLIEFAPREGLTLRSLNDGKSAFASYKFEPSFFERCSGKISNTNSRSKHKNRSRDRGRECREGNEEDEERYMCRILLKTVAAVLKPRRGVDSLRLRSSSEHKDENNNVDISQENYSSTSCTMKNGSQRAAMKFVDGQGVAMQLIFEFRCEPGGLRISHRVGVSELESSVSAVAPRDNCSEIVAAPKALMKMIDPLKRTMEVALNVNSVRKTVILSSFHHSDAASSSVDIALLGAAAVLKTQTSMACDDFDDFIWKNNRSIYNDEVEIPNGVNEEVILVFGIKEVKAFLQFCHQANTDNEERMSCYFEWGGRPIIFESTWDSFSCELIMATLDHKLLKNTYIASQNTPKSARCPPQMPNNEDLQT